MSGISSSAEPASRPSKEEAATDAQVQICFMNRYLEPLDSIRYRIEYDDTRLVGETTTAEPIVEIRPCSTEPVRVFVWSRNSERFKLIDEFVPVSEGRLLVHQRLKTFRHQSETEKHPDINHQKQEAAGSSQTGPTNSNSTTSALEQGVGLSRSRNRKDEPIHEASRRPKDRIYRDELKRIFPGSSLELLEQVCDELNHDLTKYKLDTTLRRAHFFAQVLQEAGPDLTPNSESLNYRCDVLIEKFSYYSRHKAEAAVDGRIEEMRPADDKKGLASRKLHRVVTQQADQKTIANMVYANRGGNGKPETGDGWRFRGRGIFQLTFRTNYEKFDKVHSKYWGAANVDFVANPDKLCEFPYFIRSAVWYWLENQVYEQADAGATDSAIDGVTEAINGTAMDGAAKRRHNFHELCYPVFK